MLRKSVDQLITLSKAIADDYSQIQGSGGNISCKIDDNQMLIKASGYNIKSIDSGSGFVNVNYKKISDSLAKKNLLDQDYISILEQATEIQYINNGLKPSMETGFHSILGRYIIHSHSALANLLTCSQEGPTIAQRIFGNNNYIWIPYYNPGLPLSQAIYNHLIENNIGRQPLILFLENHGLIISANEVSQCIKLNNYINDTIRSKLIPPTYPELFDLIDRGHCYVSQSKYLTDFFQTNSHNIFNEVLFPDQVIFLRRGKLTIENPITYFIKHKEAKTIEETLLLYTYLLSTFKNLNLTAKFLKEDDINYLDNAETEKHRRNIISQ